MYVFIKDFGLILILAKLFGLIARKLGAPQVIGEILAGLVLGPCVLDVIESGDTISLFAEVGVIILLFSTGLGTDLKKLLKTGPAALLMASCGVLVPLIGGYLLYSCFYGFSAVGSADFYKAVFIGTIMTATSVSITVATLQELGKISTTLGTTVVSAAIIDDVIGIIVLTCVIGASGSENTSLPLILLKTLLFFCFAIFVGFILNIIMKKVDEKAPHTQRLPIFALGTCFLMAWIAETCFGIADITGAYITGVALCTIDDAKYIEKRVDISGYMLFAPIFFANIGLQTEFDGMTASLLLFSVLFVAVALICKIIGCGAAAKVCGYNNHDALIAGVGMMTRGEVALIVAQKGLTCGMVDSSYFSAVILLIIVSSILTPLLLKALYAKKTDETVSETAPENTGNGKVSEKIPEKVSEKVSKKENISSKNLRKRHA